VLQAAEKDPDLLKFKSTVPSLKAKKISMGDVFMHCNWVLHNHPVNAMQSSEHVSPLTNPHPGSKQLVTSAGTTLVVCLSP
ncbi:uncharacterized protein F5891DRAFT_950356, partial [Suillus fuscotomentosus]